VVETMYVIFQDRYSILQRDKIWQI